MFCARAHRAKKCLFASSNLLGIDSLCREAIMLLQWTNICAACRDRCPTSLRKRLRTGVHQVLVWRLKLMVRACREAGFVIHPFLTIDVCIQRGAFRQRMDVAEADFVISAFRSAAVPGAQGVDAKCIGDCQNPVGFIADARRKRSVSPAHVIHDGVSPPIDLVEQVRTGDEPGAPIR